MRSFRWVLLIVGIAWLGACSGTSLPSCEGGASGASAGDAYQLGPGDRVRVTVFGQPDLSGEFRIAGDGYLALPLLGDFLAAGLTTRELAEAIAQRLREEGLLVDPKVVVELLTYRPIYMLGEVARPGSYEYREDMTVSNAVALAGGYTYRAEQSAATIERAGCSLAAPPEERLEPGDVVTVPERLF
jgi:protein involved in polysaccharide export with SLBB domain